MLRTFETDHRVGTAELGRIAQTYAEPMQSKALPAAVKAQADLNDRLALEVSRLAGVSARLSAAAQNDQAEPGCSDSQRPGGLLSELGQEQVRTSRLVTALGNLNDHLEALI